MIAIFDADGGGDVDFEEFVGGLSAFSNKGDKEQKLRFAFKVYDIDRDGYISNGELFIVLKMMVGSNLKDQQLQQIVDKTIMEADLDKDGKISFEEFTKMVENTDVSMSMTLGMSYLLPSLSSYSYLHSRLTRLCRPVLKCLGGDDSGGPRALFPVACHLRCYHDNDLVIPTTAFYLTCRVCRRPHMIGREKSTHLNDLSRTETLFNRKPKSIGHQHSYTPSRQTCLASLF